jgi:hypothetical protein
LTEQLGELNSEMVLAKVQIINGIVFTEQEVDTLFETVRQQAAINNELFKILAGESLQMCTFFITLCVIS